MGQPGLAEMHLGVDHAGQDMQPPAVDHLAGRRWRKVADRRDTAGGTPMSRDALAVLIDDDAALEDHVEALGHVQRLPRRPRGPCCLHLSAYVPPRVPARDSMAKPQRTATENCHESSVSSGSWRGARSAGDAARHFLNGLVTTDMAKVAPAHRALCRAADAARARSSSIFSSPKRRPTMAADFLSIARGRWQPAAREAEFLQAARQGHLRRSVGRSRCAGGLGRRRHHRHGLSYPDPRLAKARLARAAA